MSLLGSVFGNLITDILFGVFILVGILLGIFLRPMMGNRVLKIDPDTHRFIELDIAEESALSIDCVEKKGMPPQKFLKFHPGFTGTMGKFLKRSVTLFLGRTGTAYTWRLEAGKWIAAGSLANAVKTLWGAAFYESVPDRQKDLLEKSKIEVTIGIAEDPITPGDMRPVTEEDIHKEEDRAASRTFWKERFAKDKSLYINIILAAGSGFAVCAILFLIGIFRIPSPSPTVSTPITTPTPTPASAIFLILHFILGGI